MFYGRQFCIRKKRGPKVGKTKRGKGTKLMVVGDGRSIPLAVSLASASPHEVKVIAQTIHQLGKAPERLIGDKAYDSDEFRKELKKQDIELIAPHRSNRCKAPTQDGRHSGVTNAAGKLNERLRGLEITDVLLPNGSITIKCIKLFSISLVS